MTQEDVALLVVLLGAVVVVGWVGLELLLWLLRVSMRLGGDVWLWGVSMLGTVGWMSHIS